jgi:retron-type reverse transcriptase
MIPEREDLFAQIVAWENLYRAYHKARKGKRYRLDVADFEYFCENNITELQHELQSGQYVPGGYRNFRIQDPKPRLISAALFRDRIVHHAIMNIIGPILDRGLISDTYSCRTEKGTHKAADKAQQLVRHYRYVLKADIVQFFPSVDHDILLTLVQKKIHDERTLALLQKIIVSGRGILDGEYRTVWFPGDDLFTPAERYRGLPIGNLTSQILANFYLNPLDQFVKRSLQVQGYVRYCDDFLLFANSVQELQVIRLQVMQKLTQLRLIIHQQKSVIQPCRRGVLFVGYRIYPYYRKLRRQNVSLFRKRIRHYRKLEAQGELSRRELLERIRSWLAHAAHADTYRLRQRLFKELFFAEDPYLCQDL